MIRSTVLAASVVWSVERTRWPVSDASSAISIVSASRISPTRITFGACRRAERSAREKLGQSRCSSRWWIVAFLCPWTNSIGSSIVTMWTACVSLIRSTMAASVDDFPEPVGPVTSTMPFFSPVMSRRAGGSFSSSNVGTRTGMTLITMAWLPRWKKTLTRKREKPGIE